MNPLLPCEFLDPDGTYLLVQPLDEVRCRVLGSNVAPPGEVLYKSADLSWGEATLDLGGCTRLGPSDLLGSDPLSEGPDPEDLLSALEEDRKTQGEHRHSDREGDVVDPRTELLPTLEGEDLDPRAELLRLALHYRKSHDRKDGARRWLSLCECPEFRMRGDSRNARLHAVVSMGILKNELPSLPRISQAIRDVEREKTEVA